MCHYPSLFACSLPACSCIAAGQGSFPCDDACIPDSINHAKFVRDLYELSKDTTGECWAA